MECLWFIDPLFGSLLTPTSYDFIKNKERSGGRSRLLLFERLWSLCLSLSLSLSLSFTHTLTLV